MNTLIDYQSLGLGQHKLVLNNPQAESPCGCGDSFALMTGCRMDDLTNQQLILEDDIEATLVPQGYPIILPTGSSVVVTQNLGGNLTVMVQGNMAMIDEDELPQVGY